MEPSSYESLSRVWKEAYEAAMNDGRAADVDSKTIVLFEGGSTEGERHVARVEFNF